MGGRASEAILASGGHSAVGNVLVNLASGADSHMLTDHEMLFMNCYI